MHIADTDTTKLARSLIRTSGGLLHLLPMPQQLQATIDAQRETAAEYAREKGDELNELRRLLRARDQEIAQLKADLRKERADLREERARVRRREEEIDLYARMRREERHERDTEWGRRE